MSRALTLCFYCLWTNSKALLKKKHQKILKIPDFRKFLEDIKNVLSDSGEFFIETGNIGDLVNSNEVPSELDLPDHLVFAGEKHIIGFLSEAGFSIVKIKKIRKDGIINILKNIIKKLIGRKVVLKIPYTSKYRSILIRAKLSDTNEK